MKKILLIVVFSALWCAGVFAQTEYEALKIGQGNEITGTARYMGMAGAFGALGGDASALKDNPAGLGVYRSSELSGTLSFMLQGSSAGWYEQYNTASLGVNGKFNNITYVAAVPLWKEQTSGLLHSNFSFGYNRIKSFNRRMIASGTTDASLADFVVGITNGLQEADLKYVEDVYDPYRNVNIPFLSILAYDSYLINPIGATANWEAVLSGKPVTTARVDESGGIGEYTFGWGGNFGNRFFVGANVNIASLYYNLESTLTEKYGDGDFTLLSRVTQNGLGVNMKLGMIFLPTNSLRIGAAFHTPTAYAISEVATAQLKFDLNNGGTPRAGKAQTPEEGAQQKFNLASPLQAHLSAAYLFGKRGLLSAEYNFIHYRGMRLSNSDGNTSPFAPENKGMAAVMNHGHVLKLGAEFKPIAQVALRAGYAAMLPATNPGYTEGKSIRLNDVHTNTEYFDDNGTNYFSLGVGYRAAAWFADLAYGISVRDERYYPYQYNRSVLMPANVGTYTHQLALSVGLRF